MSATLSDLIKVKNFEKMSYVVFLRNEKTGKTLIKKEDCSISGLDLDAITILVPKTFCGDGQSITLFIYKEPMKDKIKIIPTQGSLKGSYEVLAKVVDIQEHEENENSFMKENHKVYVTLIFSQYDKFMWKSICEDYQKVQDEINQVIKMASEE